MTLIGMRDADLPRPIGDQADNADKEIEQKAAGSSLRFFQVAAGIASVYCSSKSLLVTVATVVLALIVSRLLGQGDK